MRRFVNVVSIQMEIKPLDITANLQKAANLLAEAGRNQKLDLVVFSEDCITGPIPSNLEFVLDQNSEAIRFFQNLAKKYKAYLVSGSFIKKKGDEYFNTSLLIDRAGRIIVEYQKNNLWHPERTYLTAGSKLPVVKTPIGTIGIIICWDLAFPQACQELAWQGADIICCPSYWTINDAGYLRKKYPGIAIEATNIDALCSARAIENEVLLIYANGAKKAGIYFQNKVINLNQVGHSQICAPIFGAVKKIKDNSEGFIFYAYDRHIAKDAEEHYKLKSDLLNFRA